MKMKMSGKTSPKTGTMRLVVVSPAEERKQLSLGGGAVRSGSSSLEKGEIRGKVGAAVDRRLLEQGGR